MIDLLAEVHAECRMRADEARAHARKSGVQELRDGANGDVLIKALQGYLRSLLRHVARNLSGHSRMFWLHLSRRFRILDQLYRYHDHEWSADNPGGVWREIFALKWHYHRLTLAILKSAKEGTRDMPAAQPSGRDGSQYVKPVVATRGDVTVLLQSAMLIEAYEHARYCLKRAGKGGQFLWIDRARGQFDVELDSTQQELVELFDQRAMSGVNLLKFAGSLAESSIGFDFPLPAGGYEPIHPLPVHSEELLIGHKEGRPLVFTLIPNVMGREAKSAWPTAVGHDVTIPPPWLFQWIDLSVLFPRFDLIRGINRKRLELLGRPSYEPEDLFAGLGAVVTWWRRRCEQHPEAWSQIFGFGYSIWTDMPELLTQEVLPIFVDLKKRLAAVREDEEEESRLLAVMEDIKWSEERYQRIDVLQGTPTYLIMPLDEREWLIDWSLMFDVILDVVGPLGRMTGTVALLRGREFEELLGRYAAKLAGDQGLFDVWWRGRQAGPLIFERAPTRDADIALVVDDRLLLVDAKAFAGDRELLIVGNPRELTRRWEETIIPALRQVDDLAERLAKEPRGQNFELPRNIKWIIPAICGPFPEWIPSRAARWWLDSETPRCFTPQELINAVEAVREGSPCLDTWRRVAGPAGRDG